MDMTQLQDRLGLLEQRLNQVLADQEFYAGRNAERLEDARRSEVNIRGAMDDIKRAIRRAQKPSNPQPQPEWAF